MTSAHEDLLGEFQDFSKTAPTAHSLMEQMAKRLHEKMTRYNWTGFYLDEVAGVGGINEIKAGPIVTSHLFVKALGHLLHERVGGGSGFGEVLKFAEKVFVG